MKLLGFRDKLGGQPGAGSGGGHSSENFWVGILGERKTAIAVPGFRGGFSHEASIRNLPQLTPAFKGGVEAVLDSTMGDVHKVGLIQVEHSFLGRFIQSYRALSHYGQEGLHIVGEFNHPMREQLVAPFARVKAPFSPGLTNAEWRQVMEVAPDASAVERYLRDIQVVYGHESSLAQCQPFLDRELHQWTPRIFPEPEQVGRAIASSHRSCLEAAGVIVGRDQDTNVIADSELGTSNKVIAGLVPPLIAEEGVRQNTMAILHSAPWGEVAPAFARFLIVCREGLEEKDISARRDLTIKTSIVVEIENEPGQLAAALLPLSKHQITKLETYLHVGFSDHPLLHIDFLGSQFDRRTKAALEKIRRCTKKLTVLGSYPVHDTIDPAPATDAIADEATSV